MVPYLAKWDGTPLTDNIEMSIIVRESVWSESKIQHEWQHVQVIHLYPALAILTPLQDDIDDL